MKPNREVLRFKLELSDARARLLQAEDVLTKKFARWNPTVTRQGGKVEVEVKILLATVRGTVEVVGDELVLTVEWPRFTAASVSDRARQEIREEVEKWIQSP